MRVLIGGGSGFVGRELTRLLRHKGHEVTVISRQPGPGKITWWEGDEGQWEPYPPALCALLDSAVSSGDASVSLPVGSGTSYEVDLKKMVQINPVTKYKRKIRSQTVKPESLDDAGELAAPNSSAPLKEEETEKQPAAKRKRAQSKSQTKSEKTPKEEIKSDDKVVRTVIMKGKAPVDPECKAKLGKAHVYCEGNVYDVMLNQAIVVTFGIFWLPYHVINMMQVAAQWYKEDSPKRHRLDHITQSSRAVTSALAFISSCANPILYTFAGKSYIRQNGFAFMARLFEGTSLDPTGNKKGKDGVGLTTVDSTSGSGPRIHIMPNGS